MAKSDQKAPKTAKKTPKKVSKSAATMATMATRSATATKSKSKSAEDENPQMNTLTTATKSKSGGPKLSIVTGERLVRSSDMASGGSAAEDENPLNSLMASFANILEVVREMRGLILGLADRVGKVEDKLEGEVDYGMRGLEDDIKEIKINVDKADSSEIFKELAWREERSKELILFKIDESDSKSWNETKTHERTELTKTINKVCAFNESEVVFIRRVGVKTTNKVRPIVVGLKSTSRRDEIVAKGRGARIGIDENLTPNQLKNKQRIKYEVRLKNECEDGHLYKLVGSAGNYKSIRVRKIDK
jgi:hypothetical protein